MHPEEKLSKTQLEKCIHCGQLILRKMSKIGSTRCQILRLKCTKFDFRWGFATDPAGGAYSEEGKGKGREEMGRERRGRE